MSKTIDNVLMGTKYEAEPKDIERFWSGVKIGNPNDCWPWQKFCNTKRGGYGMFNLGHREPMRAHRFALMLATGVKQPRNILAMHSCDNKVCCNPAHLRWGTNSENIKEAYERNHAFSEKARKIMSRIGSTYKPGRKLLDSQVEYIYRLRKVGYSQSKCAKWYGVSKAAIYDIEHGHTFKNLALATIKSWEA